MKRVFLNYPPFPQIWTFSPSSLRFRMTDKRTKSDFLFRRSKENCLFSKWTLFLSIRQRRREWRQWLFLVGGGGRRREKWRNFSSLSFSQKDSICHQRELLLEADFGHMWRSSSSERSQLTKSDRNSTNSYKPWRTRLIFMPNPLKPHSISFLWETRKNCVTKSSFGALLRKKDPFLFFFLSCKHDYILWAGLVCCFLLLKSVQ